MSSSLRLGINLAKQRGARACIIILGDQPFVSHSLITSLWTTYRQHRMQGIRIVRPTYDGMPNHPVLFDASLFPEFEALRGDEGARSIVAAHQSATMLVPCQEPLWHLDIDTMDAWERAKPHLLRRLKE